MKKPEGLKRLLLAAVPGLAADPTRLAMFIDKGKLTARGTGTLSFEYSYTLNIVVQDYSGEIDDLMVPIVAWVAEMQPDLLDRAPNEPFTFESEILDGDAADVSIDLELTEAVRVVRKPEGGFTATHLDEPSREDAFAGVCGVNLWQLLLREDMNPASVIAVPDRG
ncbi:phage tail protein [Sphingomonas sp. NFR15]|uniref:phage tail protein n=1 Tax=Sphingomonas sp. NFR15 TaxID=1566282 RepID=UPI0008849407|nr:phage tail protein [Sphingomonas sp. NFR15]SDA21556.1 P2 phage tail completion protein R (GpR) [Sphingomonas sp. NFR15]